MNEIGIICILSEDVRNYQGDLRQKIATQLGLSDIANPIIPAHITIKYRFPVENLDEIEKAVQEFSAAQSKTKWSLQGFSHFKNDDDYVIFIDVSRPKKPVKPMLVFSMPCGKSVGYNGDNSTMPIYITMSL